MTFMQRLLTPGQPMYWAMLLLPNVLIMVFALNKCRRYRPYVWLLLGAALNIAVPYAHIVVFNRGNGINAVGTPEWMVWILGTVWTNQGTILLLLALLTLNQFAAMKDKDAVT